MANADRLELRENLPPYHRSLELMYRNDELTDVEIRIGDSVFRGHRTVLAAVFPRLKQRLQSKTPYNGRVEITLRNLDPSAFECLLDFAYTGRIGVDKDNVKKLVAAAIYLQQNRVREVCLEFLCGHFSLENVLDLRAFGNSISCHDFVRRTDFFIDENFELLRKTQGFLNAPFELVKDIVSRTDIQVKKTENVYEAISAWIDADPSCRTGKFKELVDSVQKQLPLPTKEEQNDSAKKNKTKGTRKAIAQTLLDLPGCNEGVFGIHTVSASGSHNRVVHNYSSHTSLWLKVAQHNKPGPFTVIVSACGLIFAFTADSLEYFDRRSWITYGDLPWDVKNRSGNAVSWGHKIYWFPNVKNRLCSVWCFDVKEEIWEEQAPSVKLRDFGLVCLWWYIYVLGGFTSTGVTSAAMTYDFFTKEFKDISPMLERKANPRCSALNDKVYVFGGYGSQSSYLNTAEMYDPTTGQWKYISPMREKWSNFSVVPLDGKIFLISVQDGVDCTVEIYDPRNNAWKESPSFPYRCSSLKAVVISP